MAIVSSKGTMQDLKNEIIRYAHSVNVDLIGFTTADSFDELRNILKERKQKNLLSGFEEENLELRTNPRMTLKTAKSIIVIGQSYFNNNMINKNLIKQSKFKGDLARIAWGEDYHIVLKKQLDSLSNFIANKYPNYEHLSFVDTGPLVDRHLAWRAGLGVFGYNNCLINETFGSWFVIGYILTNLELEPDKPKETRFCSSCNLCIRECPTGALEKPYLINPKKCISYILQSKENIDVATRELLGTRLYGCDKCQNMCPQNFDVKITALEEFKSSRNQIDLIELLNISNREFKIKFSKNSAGWRGKKILQRNAIIALGNQKNKDALPYIFPFLSDARAEIREYAKWAINKIDSDQQFF